MKNTSESPNVLNAKLSAFLLEIQRYGFTKPLQEKYLQLVLDTSDNIKNTNIDTIQIISHINDAAVIASAKNNANNTIYTEYMQVLEHIKSNVQDQYQKDLSQQYNGIPITSLLCEFGAKSSKAYTDIKLSISALDNINKITIKGDGNCGFRAIVQALLINGITNDKRSDVIQFLRNIYKKSNNEFIENLEHSTKSIIEDLKQQNINLQNELQTIPNSSYNNAYDKIMYQSIQTLIRINDQKIRNISQYVALNDATFEAFITEYAAVAKENIAPFTDKYFITKADVVPEGDNAIYNLAGYLRYDFANFNLNTVNIFGAELGW